MNIPINWNSDNGGNEKSTAKVKLSESAAEIAFSENMKAFKFEPIETQTAHNVASCVFAVFGYISPAETLSFTFLGSTVTLEASATPSSGQFWTSATNTTTSDYLEKVAESISDTLIQNLAFNSNYSISGAGANVQIYAKSNGDEFNITASSAAAIFTTSTVGTAKFESQKVIDYSGWCEVYIANEVYAESVDKFAAILVDSYLVDSGIEAAQIAINSVGNYVEPVKPIRNLVASNEIYQMDLGTSGGGLIIPDEETGGLRRYVLRPYFIVYGDSYRFIENGQRKRFVTGVTPVRWVQLGAFDKLRPYDLQNFVWMPEQNKTFSWLTSAPNKKSITYDSHEYIQVICRKASQSLTANLSVVLRFYDGTTSVLPLPSFSVDNLAGNISFDVSPVAFGLEDYELLISGKKIESYEVSLKWVSASGVTNKSDSIKYELDRNCYENKNQVIYLNEFGAWDSIEFKGAKQKTVTRKTDKIVKPLPFGANKSAATSSEVTVNISTETNTTTTIHSGLMSNEHHEHAKKILDSSAVYIWNSEINKYESINIVDYSYLYDTKNGGASISISFNRTVSNNTINR